MIDRRHVLALLAAASALPSRRFANVAPPRSEIRPDLAKLFSDAGTRDFCRLQGRRLPPDLQRHRSLRRSEAAGVDLQDSEFVDCARDRVVGDPDKDIFKWDGVVRSFDAWKKYHTLRSAIAASVVPVYQESRGGSGGADAGYVDLLEYGNRNIGGGIDQFWLTGDLRIDPVQQVDFVDRLRRGAFPVSKRSQDLVRDIFPVTKSAMP